MQTVVEKFKLSDWVGQEAARAKLVEAGYRGQGPYVVFLFFRMVAPVAMLRASLAYVFLIVQLDIAWTLKLGICIGATYLGMHVPQSVHQQPHPAPAGLDQPGFPDALDLLLICVESGMSLESAFQRVSQEIGAAIDRARRGAHAGDGGTVLPAGPPPGLRESRQARAARRREIPLPWPCSRASALERRWRRRCA